MTSSFKLPFLLFLSSLFLHAALGEIICEELPTDVCAFSISSSGKRCLLENSRSKGGKVEYQCKTSEVVFDKMSNYIETDDCVRACGVDRKAVGISSDALLEPQFTAKLCSRSCYQRCPNIVDLYFNLAAGEGAFLPHLCEAQRTNPHRAMIQLSSSGLTLGQITSQLTSSAPASAPAPASYSSNFLNLPKSGSVPASAPGPNKASIRRSPFSAPGPSPRMRMAPGPNSAPAPSPKSKAASPNSGPAPAPAPIRSSKLMTPTPAPAPSKS